MERNLLERRPLRLPTPIPAAGADRWRKIGCIAALVVLFHLSVALSASATLFVKMSDGELADVSPIIVEGQIIHLSAAHKSHPAVDYTLRIDQRIQGAEHQDHLTVRLPGGRSGDLFLAILGTPKWRLGDKLLLFLTPGGNGTVALSQHLLSAFRIVSLGPRRLAVRDLSGAHEIQIPGNPAPLDGPRDLLSFRHWLRDRNHGLQRPADYFVAPDIGSPSMGSAKSEKFEILVSSTDPFPLGCGGNGGHPVRWFTFEQGESATFRTYFSGQPGLVNGGLTQVQQALDAWSADPNTPVSLNYGGITAALGGLRQNDGINSFLFDDPLNEIGGSYADSGILALGGPWFSCDLTERQGDLFHPIVEADIITQDGLGQFFVSLLNPGQAAAEIFAHELGHTLGLAHSTAPEALMFAELHNDGRGATLNTDDLAGLQYLYAVQNVIPPLAPQDLTVTAELSERVRLEWVDHSDNESGFRIQRKATGDFINLAVSPAGATTFIDRTTKPDTAYTYQVQAFNGAGDSPFSNEATATTPQDLRPRAPSNLRAAPLSSQRIRLSWQDNANNEDGFRLFVLRPSTAQYVEVPFAIDADATSINLTNLDPRTTLTLQLRARNAFGDSSPSNPVTVTTFQSDGGCTVTGTALCLEDGRFRVEVRFKDPHSNLMKDAIALPDTDITGTFWFFQAENTELIVKVLNGIDFNNHYWVFYGGLSDVEYHVQVTDTITGATKTYTNQAGNFCGKADTLAFPANSESAFPPGQNVFGRATSAPSTNATTTDSPIDGFLYQWVLESSNPLDSRPAGDPFTDAAHQPPFTGKCIPGPQTLCLLNQRIKVTANWQSSSGDGSMGLGQAVVAGPNSGEFWFFDRQNTELVVKALDGTHYNQHLWIFFGALSDVEYQLQVTDTQTGVSKTYQNPAGNICGQADTEAFPLTNSPD